jgi:hypothetical protein
VKTAVKTSKFGCTRHILRPSQIRKMTTTEVIGQNTMASHSMKVMDHSPRCGACLPVSRPSNKKL